ncbi:hypothetical protein BROSI_A0326 [Candidatus Brocadia sinica JPN1]|uniref:Uncharacterized protein n=1 Tax=Candidatus Brocadia sinica JPN1 TaxID=1197129 RepID=A0ABQ0JSX0_9BACT|nr:hypothetical protein BROSI_A0326 [Candidatus Brocadia sinica JPN1]
MIRLPVMFQFLIGSMKVIPLGSRVWVEGMFQFLIGSMKVSMLITISALTIRFNSL